jgi:hypothetical protein
MRKVLFAAILVTIISAPVPTYAFQPTAIDPHAEVLTPGVTRYFTITQYNSYPQDFAFFLVLLIGYGPAQISLSSFEDETEGNILGINGWAISSAGVVPIIKFGRPTVDLDVGVEIGSERNPIGIMWFSTWIAGPLEEELTYYIEIGF